MWLLGLLLAGAAELPSPGRGLPPPPATTPAAVPVPAAPATLRRFGRVEYATTNAALGLTGADNPYDPAAVAVDAIVTQPDGARALVPAFWYQPMRAVYATAKRADSGTQRSEDFAPDGAGDWRWRFAPEQAGPNADASW